MTWLFKTAETVTPDLVTEDVSGEDSNIVETEFDGCAWCGDGEGCCAMHSAQLAAQADAYHAAKREGRR
jgi:hypothetical protein